MATLLTVYSSGKPVDFYYMVAEPNYKDTINVYLNGNSCSATFADVSINPDKAKFKLNHDFRKLKLILPALVKPIRPSSLMDVLEDLVTKYYVTTVSLTPEHKRRLKLREKQSVELSADSVIEEYPDSPEFQDDIDDDFLIELANLEESKIQLDEAIEKQSVEDTLKLINNNLNSQGKLLLEVCGMIKEMKEDISQIKSVQREQASLHLPEAVSTQKYFCIYCAEEAHNESDCIKKIMTCTVCGLQGHGEKVHEVKDPLLQARIIEKHGVKLFTFV